VLAAGARYELDEIVAAEDELVIAVFRIAGRGARSNVPIAFRWVSLTWFRGGLIARIVDRTFQRETPQTLCL
jgi:ketosteroid isomerase-like protein